MCTPRKPEHAGPSRPKTRLRTRPACSFLHAPGVLRKTTSQGVKTRVCEALGEVTPRLFSKSVCTSPTGISGQQSHSRTANIGKQFMDSMHLEKNKLCRLLLIGQIQWYSKRRKSAKMLIILSSPATRSFLFLLRAPTEVAAASLFLSLESFGNLLKAVSPRVRISESLIRTF